MTIIIYIAIAVVGLAIGAFGTMAVQKSMARSRAKTIIDEAVRESDVILQKAKLKGREEGLKIKDEAEKQANQRLSKVQSTEAKMKQREMQLNQQHSENQRQRNDLEALRQRLNAEEAVIETRKDELDKLKRSAQDTLEHISGLSSEEAKEKLIESLKDEAKTAAAQYVNEIMDEAKMTANKEAKRIVIQSIQRVATEAAIENSVTVFHIDSDEIKGRIIGREGRNIRALEAATGIEIIVDDTPEAIVLSGFDPVRREVARLALEKLIADGRIHPTRIEDLVEKARKEVDRVIKQEGERATFETGINNLHPELIKLLGRQKYRTSYGQNVLNHSIEVAHIAGLLASELGVDVALAKRAGLLHDLGKSVDHEMEGSHVQLGVELARKYNESPDVIHAIEAHHNDVEPRTVIACLVQAADAISAARPGARRENVENYIRRLEKLEELTGTYPGVEKSYAIQAGREVRIMVKPEDVSEDNMVILARELTKKIESELEYPGQIKVNVIRETKVVEYAK